MRRRRLAGLALGVWLCAAPASAGNGIASIEVRTHANLTSVAVHAIVRGDDDSSAVLRIFQRRVGAAAFDTGMVMVRRVGFGPTTGDARADNARAGNVYEGRILWLAPGDRVEFYVEGRDAGGDFTTKPMVVTPATVRQLEAAGPVFYVSAGTGNDQNDGSQAAPKRSINAALDALAASLDHGRYGGIFIAPGEYHERIEFDAKRFPDDGGPWFIEGDGTNRDSTIVCGADPWVEKGVYAPGKPIRWAFTGQDSTWACYLPGATGPGDSTQLVVLGWGEMLHRKTSIKAVLDDSTFAYRIESPGGVGQGELSGWWWQNDTLYVKRTNGQSPEGSVLHIGHLDRLFDICRRNVRIANLTFRYAGGMESTFGRYRAMANPGLMGNGVAAGAFGTASGVVIDSCRFYGFNAPAIYILHGGGGRWRADSAVVAHCIIDGLRIGDWLYGAGKARPEEVAGQVFFRTYGGSFIDNLVMNTFNGIGADTAPTDSTAGSDCEYVRCTFRHMTDDAIELDDSHCINTLVAADTMIDTGSGISIAPLLDGGPMFALYNAMLDIRWRGIKGGNDSEGLARFAHNTIYVVPTGGAAVDLGPGGGHDGTWFANNILAGGGSARAINGPPIGGKSTNAFNYDVLCSVSDRTVAAWNHQDLTFSALQALGWEHDGHFLPISDAGWLLSPTSPAPGTGRRLTGIDTGLDGNRYTGSAPAVGAGELRGK